MTDRTWRRTSYDAMTGVYTLANGAKLTAPDGDSGIWKYTDETGSIRLVPYSEQKDLDGELTGTANVEVSENITIPIAFVFHAYEDGTFALDNNRTDSVFEGTWSFADDGSLLVECEVLEVLSHELSGGIQTLDTQSSITAGDQVYSFHLPLSGEDWR